MAAPVIRLALVRAEARALTRAPRRVRPVAREAAALDQQRYAAELPHALEGELAQSVVLLDLVPHADEEVVVVAHLARHDLRDLDAARVVGEHLIVVLGGIEGVEGAVTQVVVQHERARVTAIVELLQHCVVPLQGALHTLHSRGHDLRLDAHAAVLCRPLKVAHPHGERLAFAQLDAHAAVHCGLGAHLADLVVVLRCLLETGDAHPASRLQPGWHCHAEG
mmetsp:Transcript_8455/g.19933  ORF Transcript_8455/g.19933 Transcript_8455/m.19933 type:complete len:222 (+) Transcript_8455:189-854(+)